MKQNSKRLHVRSTNLFAQMMKMKLKLRLCSLPVFSLFLQFSPSGMLAVYIPLHMVRLGPIPYYGW